MTDMMLTGRVYNAEDGERAGFAQYLVPEGQAFSKALELAKRVAQNAPLTNYALMHALPRIAEQPADQGFLTEALMAAIAQSAPEAKAARARLPRRPPPRSARAEAHDEHFQAAAPRYRPLAFGVTRAVLREGAAGIALPARRVPLDRPTPERMTDRLVHWAAPARPHLHRAARAAGRRQHRRLAQVSYARRCRGPQHRPGAAGARPVAERPVAILSENSLEHALLALGCLYAGIPYCPVSPAYSWSARTSTSCATCWTR
jgi:hypothetical protein